jgi:hypothetical protein
VKSRGDKEMDTGRMEAGRRQVGGRSEAGRRQVGDKSEEYYLIGHPNGMQIPKFRRGDLGNLEFKSYLSKEFIKSSFQSLSFFVRQRYKIILICYEKIGGILIN